MTGNSLRVAPHQTGLLDGLPRLVKGRFHKLRDTAGGKSWAERWGQANSWQEGALLISTLPLMGLSEELMLEQEGAETTDRGKSEGMLGACLVKTAIPNYSIKH